jgi:dUTP pyrophosphatase
MIKFKQLSQQATIPTRGSDYSAGLDLAYCGPDFELFPGDFHTFGTGVACAIPEGFYGQIAPRSGLAIRHGIDTLAGVIDSDYRGELGVVLVNHGHRPWKVHNGMRIAQMIVKPVLLSDAVWVNDLDETDRGTGGFGSTGE